MFKHNKGCKILNQTILVILLILWTHSELLANELSITKIMKEMTLEQKVGQMFIIGFSGRRMSQKMQNVILEHNIGGFFVQILTNFNFPDECAKLTNSIQETAIASSLGIPLFIAADQEGGVAAPIHYMMGATPTPGNMALGASGRERDSYVAYSALGNDMRACGLNVNFAPAIDVLTSAENPDYTIRSFGSDMQINGNLARGSVKGLQENGVIACAKHFPGLAYFDEDTHSHLPIVNMNEEELMSGNMAHFRGAIQGGTDMIMTVHAIFTGWDADNSATLSYKILTGVLRKKLGYKGLIITDSMGMGAITKDKGFDLEETTIRSVEAGNDIILQVSRNIDEFERRIKTIVSAVKAGRLSERRIDISVRRILQVKYKYGLFANPKVNVDEVYQKIAPPELVEANQQAALNGIVVVRDENNLLPLQVDGKKIAVISAPAAITRAGKGESFPIGYTVGAHVRKYANNVVNIRVDTVPTKAEVDYALSKVIDADIIIGYCLLAQFSPTQVAFIKKILLLEKPTVILGLGTCSDLALFPEAKTFIAVNSPAPVSTEAAVKVLFGKAKPGGKLPMAINNLYPVGYKTLIPAKKYDPSTQ